MVSTDTYKHVDATLAFGPLQQRHHNIGSGKTGLYRLYGARQCSHMAARSPLKWLHVAFYKKVIKNFHGTFYSTFCQWEFKSPKLAVDASFFFLFCIFGQKTSLLCVKVEPMLISRTNL